MKKIWAVIALSVAMFACGSKTEGTTGSDTGGGGGGTTPAVAKNPWGSFKVGSYTSMKATTSTEVGGNKTNMTTETKMTLMNLTADKATIETAITMMGNTNKTTMDIPLTAAQTAPTPPAGAPTPKTGTETLTIAGKSLSCKWTETETEASGNKVTSKIWMSEEVPGFVVKMVTSTKGAMSSEMTSEVTDFKAM